jgi:hypothetical protein
MCFRKLIRTQNTMGLSNYKRDIHYLSYDSHHRRDRLHLSLCSYYCAQIHKHTFQLQSSRSLSYTLCTPLSCDTWCIHQGHRDRADSTHLYRYSNLLHTPSILVSYHMHLKHNVLIAHSRSKYQTQSRSTAPNNWYNR